VNDSRKIAPVGWHVASDLEWTTLENFLIANGGNYDGTVIGNKISKALATNTDWNDGPVNAKEGAVCLDLSTNNSSGFSALPAGSFSGSQGEFFGLGFNANWWTSTEFDATTAYRRYIKNVTQDEEKGSIDKYEGLSVRCIKD